MKPSRKKISRAASRMRPRDCAFLASRRSFARTARRPSSRRAIYRSRTSSLPSYRYGSNSFGLDVALAEARDHDDDRSRRPVLRRLAYSIAATTAAPEEIPQRRPSSRASRRAISSDASPETVITRSTSDRSSTSGTKPAPMPWIGCTPGGAAREHRARRGLDRDRAEARACALDHLRDARDRAARARRRRRARRRARRCRPRSPRRSCGGGPPGWPDCGTAGA